MMRRMKFDLTLIVFQNGRTWLTSTRKTAFIIVQSVTVLYNHIVILLVSSHRKQPSKSDRFHLDVDSNIISIASVPSVTMLSGFRGVNVIKVVKQSFNLSLITSNCSPKGHSNLEKKRTKIFVLFSSILPH